MGSLRETAWNLLPGFLKKMRLTWVLGKIGERAKDNEFLYDYRILSRLNFESYSQHGQDAFIWNFIFDRKEEGVFLDVGGNDPVIINNSYLFETKGWTGFAFEPIRTLCDKWKDKRKTPCYNVAIGSECKDEIEFSQSELDYLSGIGVKDRVSEK